MASANQPAGVRRNRRQQILDFFSGSLGVRFTSAQLHAAFGSSFRTRVSELNRDPAVPITLFNQVTFNAGAEHSVYWAELRDRTPVGETFQLFNSGTGPINFDHEARHYPE